MNKTGEHLQATADQGSSKREPLYRLSQVEKTYQQKGRTVKALRGVDLEIMPGELVVIQGTTGGGKSTLLQMLGALDRPTAGSVHLAGRDITILGDRALADLRAHDIGFVFQHYNLIPTLSALENVEMGLAPLRLAPSERLARASAALASVGLAERRTHLPGELSGGQQQRVAIARALAKKPRVLLADEPTGNLDEATRDEIRGLFEELWRAGLSIVMVSPDSAVARRAGRLLRISKGTVTEVG
ncbi:ABC transporter ATP-binding protein [Paeniglutamicibacter cryotolerans]